MRNQVVFWYEHPASRFTFGIGDWLGNHQNHQPPITAYELASTSEAILYIKERAGLNELSRGDRGPSPFTRPASPSAVPATGDLIKLRPPADRCLG